MVYCYVLLYSLLFFFFFIFFFVQAEDGIRDLVRSRGLGDVYKRQDYQDPLYTYPHGAGCAIVGAAFYQPTQPVFPDSLCLLYTSDAADERSSVDLGGRRIIKKKKTINIRVQRSYTTNKEEEHLKKNKMKRQKNNKKT